MIKKELNEESETENEEEKVLQVPVFLTQADINRMTYENNMILKQIHHYLKEEVEEEVEEDLEVKPKEKK